MAARRELPAAVGGAAILFAVFMVVSVLPQHPRLVRAELTSLADQPDLPMTLEPKPAISLPKAQKLMYIVPEHHGKMGDYFDFMNACKKACGPSATLGRQKCGADELTPIYLDYRSKCKADFHGCACEITYMYCG
jgi:hypothetical protein